MVKIVVSLGKSYLYWWDWSFEACNYPRPPLPPSPAFATRYQEHPKMHYSSCDEYDAYFAPFDFLFSWGQDWYHYRSVLVRCCSEQTLLCPRGDDDDGEQLKQKSIHELIINLSVFFQPYSWIYSAFNNTYESRKNINFLELTKVLRFWKRLPFIWL